MHNPLFLNKYLHSNNNKFLQLLQQANNSSFKVFNNNQSNNKLLNKFNIKIYNHNLLINRFLNNKYLNNNNKMDFYNKHNNNRMFLNLINWYFKMLKLVGLINGPTIDVTLILVKITINYWRKMRALQNI